MENPSVEDFMQDLFERLKTESLEQVILNTYKDLTANVKIAGGNLKKLLVERNFHELGAYYAQLEYTNAQIRMHNGKRKPSKKGKFKMTPEKIAEIEAYYEALPPGEYDIRKNAKELEVPVRSLANVIRQPDRRRKLELQKKEQQYKWDKSPSSNPTPKIYSRE